MALALTGLAALGLVWLRERRAAGRPRPPAGELRLRLDLNAASAEELDLIPGVGPGRAARIVEVRKARGGFRRLAELDEPALLGPGAAERLAAYFAPLPGDRR
jgi:competence protein ComEA